MKSCQDLEPLLNKSCLYVLQHYLLVPQRMELVDTILITIKMIMRLVVATIFHNSCQDSNFLCFPQRAAASYLRTTLWRADNVMHWAFVPFWDPWTKSQKFVWGPFAGPGIGLNQSEAIQNCLTRQVQMYTEQEGMPRLWNFSWLLALCHWNSPIDIAITITVPWNVRLH